MRRPVVVLLSVVALVGTLLVGGVTFGVAQDTATTDSTGHPVVGTWVLDTDIDDPGNPPEVVIFTADGGYISVDAEGFPSLGVWEATGDRTATLTLSSGGVEEDGAFAGTFTIRASVEVDATGDTLTATYSGEFVPPDGTSTGEYGPGSAQATRLVAEPMGTPAGPLSILFEGEDTGTPEATPAP